MVKKIETRLIGEDCENSLQELIDIGYSLSLGEDGIGAFWTHYED